MARDTIGPFEHEVIAAVLLEGEGAYGLAIRDRIKAQAGRPVSIGAVYTALERLERKGMVSSRWGEATPERGGRRKRLYKVEGVGQAAVEAFRRRFAVSVTLMQLHP